MEPLLDAAGHQRSLATMPGYHRAWPPRNKSEQYLADPPTVDEVIEVMRVAGNNPDGQRLRALIVILWRAGLRISEALALQESDLDHDRGAILARPESVAGPLRINCDTLMPWRWPTRVCRSLSSNANRHLGITSIYLQRSTPPR